MKTAHEKFESFIQNRKHICVGLDTDIDKIPVHLLNNEDPIFEFNKIIVDNTIDEAAAYKLNFAFYEKHGIEGLVSLRKTIEYIGKETFIIGDAKRGDIANTSTMYAQSLFDYFNVDASTINPYMGSDSVKPFLKYEDKINFILALTSNSGANDFEKLILNDYTFVFQKVIDKIHLWNEKKNCGVVFGATNPEELKRNISSLKNLPILLPGIGAQGGDLEKVVSVFVENKINSFLINSSRGIIYKDNSKNFGKAAAKELHSLNTIVQQIFKKSD